MPSFFLASTSAAFSAFTIAWLALFCVRATSCLAASFSSVVASWFWSIVLFWFVAAWSTSFLAFVLVWVSGTTLPIFVSPFWTAVSTCAFVVAALISSFAVVTAWVNVCNAASFSSVVALGSLLIIYLCWSCLVLISANAVSFLVFAGITWLISWIVWSLIWFTAASVLAWLICSFEAATSASTLFVAASFSSVVALLSLGNVALRWSAAWVISFLALDLVVTNAWTWLIVLIPSFLLLSTLCLFAAW